MNESITTSHLLLTFNGYRCSFVDDQRNGTNLFRPQVVDLRGWSKDWHPSKWCVCNTWFKYFISPVRMTGISKSFYLAQSCVGDKWFDWMVRAHTESSTLLVTFQAHKLRFWLKQIKIDVINTTGQTASLTWMACPKSGRPSSVGYSVLLIMPRSWVWSPYGPSLLPNHGTLYPKYLTVL